MEEHNNLSHAPVPLRKEAERGGKKFSDEKIVGKKEQDTICHFFCGNKKGRSSLEGRLKEQKTWLRAPSLIWFRPPSARIGKRYLLPRKKEEVR